MQKLILLKLKSQQGMVSLVTALVVSFFLILMALALTAVIGGVLQQSSGNELTQRAYAAAEGGVEWMFAYLRSPGHSLAEQYRNCRGSGSLESTGIYDFSWNYGLPYDDHDNKITCALVLTHNNKTEGTLDLANNQQVQLLIPTPAAGTPIANIKLDWISLGTEPLPNIAPSAVGALPPQCPASGCLNAAALEATIVDFSSSTGTAAGNVDPSFIDIRNVVFLPSNGAETAAEPKYVAACSNPGAVVGAANPYACHATIAPTKSGGATVAGQTVLIVHLRPMYLVRAGTAGPNTASRVSYKISFLDSVGNAIQVPTGITTLDVTARSGPFTRRVIAGIGNQNPEVQFNYLLYGDKDVCKQFYVYYSTQYNFEPTSICPLP